MTPDATAVARALRPHLHAQRDSSPAWGEAWAAWRDDVAMVLREAPGVTREQALAECAELLDEHGHHAGAELVRERGGARDVPQPQAQATPGVVRLDQRRRG